MKIAPASGGATCGAGAATDAVPPALPPGHARPAACLNCDTPLTGKFCADCGQPAATHRLTMGHLLHEIPHAVWHVDKGIVFTLHALLLRPGATVLGYLGGQRARYFAPVSLLLLVTGVASFVAVKTGVSERASTLNGDASAALRAAQAQGSDSVFHYMSWIYVAMSPLIAWVARRALRRARLNLAEALVAVCYLTAAGNLLALLLTPFNYGIRSATAYFWVSTGSSLLLLAYQGWAYGQLLLHTSLGRWGRWWRGLLTAVAAYALVMLGGLVLTFALNWGSFKAAGEKDLKARRAQQQHAAPAAPPRP